MNNFFFQKFSSRKQYILSISIVLFVSSVCYVLSAFIDYRVVALILLVTVSLNAMFFDIKPVLLAAILSTAALNFLFIPPKFSFTINNTEDILLFSMYFVVALVNAALTYKIRQYEKEASKREEKENTFKLYNTLLNSLSHELRTPISTIIGATDNLLTMADKLSELNKHELVHEISKSAIQLNRQVNNLLNMSRLESGFIKPKKDWVDMNELIYDVISQLKDTLQGKLVHVSVKENLPLFKLDYGLMLQVLYNLIHNAAVYIPKQATITVRAFCKDDKAVIVVEDTGKGFPEKEINKVFDKFYRLDNSATGGTGLGLSIVKGFVESMDGTIRLENRPEGGAVFTIEIATQLSFVNVIKT